MELFGAVKSAVTTRQAAEFYGVDVKSNGMARCIFHNDRNPSMKLDKRYHCFGCQADGDVINFVAGLFGRGNKEAAEKIANDFGISYDKWKPDRNPYLNLPFFDSFFISFIFFIPHHKKHTKQNMRHERKITVLETKCFQEQYQTNKLYGRILKPDNLRVVDTGRPSCRLHRPGLRSGEDRYPHAGDAGQVQE